MKVIFALLFLLLGGTQYVLWCSKSGLSEYFALKRAIAAAQMENAQFSARNEALAQEISHLKQGSEAIEEHARNDLGMIKQGETFYRVIPKHPQDIDL